MENGARTPTIGMGADADVCFVGVGPSGTGYAEMYADTADLTLFAVEARVVARAAAKRRREFATVRHCARQALRRIGLPAVPILPGPGGAPSWPVGVVGSLTHCDGYRAALVARASELRSLGLDAEPHAELPADTHEFVLRDEERAQVAVLANARPDLHWDRILFCAKEAVYKAWFPLTRRWLDFADLTVRAELDGSFRAELGAHQRQAAGSELHNFNGQWRVARGLIVAATSVRRRSPAQSLIRAVAA